MTRIFLSLVLLLALAVPGWGVTYYVNATGGDDSRTTAQAQNPATPWLTLMGAETKASTGDTVHAATGTYNENDATFNCWYCQKGIAWIADGAVTVTSTSTSYTLLTNADVVASWTGFAFDGEDADDNVIRIAGGGDTKTFTSCTIQDPATNGHWCEVSAANSQTLAWNTCTFTSNNALTSCIVLGSAINCTVTGCAMTATTGDALPASGASGTLTVSNNTGTLTFSGVAGDFVSNSGSQAIVVTGNEITFAGTPATGVVCTGAGSTGAVTISDNTFTAAVKWITGCILINTGTHVVDISDNTITCSADAQTTTIVKVVDQVNPVIHGNAITTDSTSNSPIHVQVQSTGTDCGSAEITDNILYAQHTGAQIILVGTDATGAGDNMLDGAIISGNDVRGGLYYNRAAAAASVHGIEFGWNSDASIFNNRVDGCPYGIVVKGGAEDYGDAGGVYYNILINCGGTNAISDSSIRLKGVLNVPVYNNVLYMHADYTLGAAGGLLNITDGEDAGDDCSGCLVKDNIFYAADGVPLIRVENDGSSLTVTDVDNNCYWNSTGSGMDFIVGATTYTSFADWQKAGFDAAGISANPLWTTAGTDYHLLPGSPCIDAGTDVGLTTDYDGNPVPSGTAVDIGALEYQWLVNRMNRLGGWLSGWLNGALQ